MDWGLYPWTMILAIDGWIWCWGIDVDLADLIWLGGFLNMYTWYVTWLWDPVIDLNRVRVCDNLDQKLKYEDLIRCIRTCVYFSYWGSDISVTILHVWSFMTASYRSNLLMT